MGQVLHIRTSERAFCEAIDEWIAHHNLEAIVCEDAFDAVVVMLTRAESTPDLVFVGMHLLDNEDTALLGWLRETWPHIAMVVCGAADGVQRRPGLTVCRDTAALLDWLKSDLTELLHRLGETSVTTPPRSAAVATLRPGLAREVDAGLSAEELDSLLGESQE